MSILNMFYNISLFTNWKFIILLFHITITTCHNRTIPTDYIDEKSNRGFSFASDSYFTRFMRRRHVPQTIKRNRCELKLVADYEFFRVIGNNNYANAARYLVILLLI